MAKINEVLCKVLDIHVESSALNYYSLLQVPLFTSDAQQIGTALQAAAARVRAAANVEPQATLDAVMKVLQQCNVTLMNPVKKAQYDEQLHAQLNNPTIKTTTAPVTAAVPKLSPAPMKSLDPLAEVLPPGNPAAEFSIKDFLNSCVSAEATESVESRLAELELLRGNYSIDSSEQYGARYLDPQSESVSTPDARQEEEPSSLLIQKRIRRKRAVKNSMIVGTLFLIAAVLLGAAVWRYLNPTRIVSNPNAEKFTDPRANAVRNSTQKTPKQPIAVTNAAGGTENDASSTNAGQPDSEPSLPELKTDKNDGQAFFSKAPEKTSPDDEPSMEMTAPTAQPESPSTTMSKGFDQAAWDDLVKQVRESIGRKDFGRFNTLVQKLLETQVENGPLNDLRLKLDRTGQLYKIGNDAFESGLKALESGATINTQDDSIGFIEATSDTVTFRIKGANKKFNKNELPEEILDALLKLNLSADAAINLAACGVFVKLYNSANNYQKMAEKYFSDAAKKDAKYSQIDDLANPAYHSN